MVDPGESRFGEGRKLQDAAPGDWLEVDAIPGADPRRGEILEVLGAGRHLHFGVRWRDGEESLFYPAPEGGVIVHRRGPDAEERRR